MNDKTGQSDASLTVSSFSPWYQTNRQIDDAVFHRLPIDEIKQPSFGDAGNTGRLIAIAVPVICQCITAMEQQQKQRNDSYISDS